VLYHWKKQYSRGKFDNEPIEEGGLKDEIENLESLRIRQMDNRQSSVPKSDQKDKTLPLVLTFLIEHQ